MKIAAVVIIYNPDIMDVSRNILRYIDYIDELIIYRNSNHIIPIPEEYTNKVTYFGDGSNKYIAKPLNEVLDYCIVNNYDYLLTMDQDSTWVNFKLFIDDVLSFKTKNVIIYSPNVNNLYSEKDSAYNVESVITSGSLCNVALVKKLGGFREDYKIYWVDGEFCYWARRNGYLIKVLSKSHLQQKFGVEEKNSFGLTGANYSPIVYYFLFRNMIWLKREFKDSISIKCMLYTFKLYGIGCIFDKEKKTTKILKIIKAIFDGVFKKIPSKRCV